jgi:cell wall-associated NlpC family hydrolase
MKMKSIAYIICLSLFLSLWSGPGEAQAYETTKATVVKSVSFRDRPSLSGDRIRYLSAGETVVILDKINSYWFKARDKNERIGYVSTSSRYLRLSDSSYSTGTQQTASATGQKIINAGYKYLGTPYEFGSSRYNTRTFDCSDFVRQAYYDATKLRLPADSRSQGAYVKQIGNKVTDWRKLKPGDIIFFMSYRGTDKSDYAGINKSTQRITHNGIYLGNGKVLHTYSKSSGGVRVDTIVGKHFEYRFLFGGSGLK